MTITKVAGSATEFLGRWCLWRFAITSDEDFADGRYSDQFWAFGVPDDAQERANTLRTINTGRRLEFSSGVDRRLSLAASGLCPFPRHGHCSDNLGTITGKIAKLHDLDNDGLIFAAAELGGYDPTQKLCECPRLAPCQKPAIADKTVSAFAIKPVKLGCRQDGVPQQGSRLVERAFRPAFTGVTLFGPILGSLGAALVDISALRIAMARNASHQCARLTFTR
ncbi:hypothetical protein G5V57_02005 [Nordella sp. HKS 07]|uniref:hypothetical protein n=1 Tax=Nordella sp. HKS 07 TaxID=2712222 RepID=UPI0013E11A30|nr:hypothetical protein [Nordella sp. HKS 07]QIG46637.1 hypothetical protein G5V57_02005 [Nordella sp. HKS 07]